MSNGTYWTVGGKGNDAQPFIKSSILFDGVSTFTRGPDLSVGFTAVCVQNLKDKETLILQQRPFGFNHNTQTFSSIASNTIPSDWASSSCGVTRDANGNPQYVVIGGGRYMEDHVQILDIATPTWSIGPSLPSHLKATVVVTYKGSFLLVGGRSNEAFMVQINYLSLILTISG